MITGKHLIEKGYKPGPWFAKAIVELNEFGVPLEGLEFKMVVEKHQPKHSYVEPYAEALPYFKNLIAENDDELENLISVEATMDVVMRTPTITAGAIMPDACPAGPIGNIPVGGVVVARNAIHPAMHSADICCSVMITGFGFNDPKRILDLIHKITDFGGGPRKKDHFPVPQSLMNRMAANPYFDGMALAMAKSHMGSQGDGNHFSFVGKSRNTGETCLVTHHGSRGVGARVYKAGMRVAESWRKRLSPNSNKINAWIPYDSEDGVKYWEALQLIREWTKLNHEVLHKYVCDILKYKSKLHFWNEHNFVFKKNDQFFHAKGSTPMRDDFVPDNHTGLRIIPLNMAEPVLIVKRQWKSLTGLEFAPHGAGRNMSRSKFLRQDYSDFQKEIEGLDIRAYSGIHDHSEFPSAYKSAKVVREQIEYFGLGEVVDEIIPYGCIMAGASVKTW